MVICYDSDGNLEAVNGPTVQPFFNEVAYLLAGKREPVRSKSADQQIRIDAASYLAHLGPGIAFVRIIADQLPLDVQIPIQFACEILFNRPCQIGGILRSEYETRFAGDDFIFQSTHVRRDHWQTEIATKKQHAALKYMRVGQN